MSESGSSEAFLGVNRSRRPLSIRLLNGLGAFGELLGLQSGIDTPELMELAQRKTGLIDFDGDYAIEALNVLIESINEEARLTPVGQLIQRRRILNALFARLKIREFQRKN
ncbi:MAG: hypothetical protein OXG05_11650, partial [Gammaproteobacteria bacterium]|nr:hypothetical protein [Gammaproteobacteria bacterium]